VFANGLWQPRIISEVSYPEAGNDSCFAVEDGSYWFQHRNDCIVRIMRRFPPSGPVYDIGGGNGFVTLAIEAAGYQAVLVEPGTGALNALKRGVGTVIRSTLRDAAFEPASIPAAGLFDVVEHVEDDKAFIKTIHDALMPGGRLYCTVPAIAALWSFEDVHAGHFRRYSARSLSDAMTAAGLRVEFVSYFFSWLVPPLFLFRTLPTMIGRRAGHSDRAGSMKADHSLPPLMRGAVAGVHRRESNRLSRGARIPFGTSIMCVARHP